MAKKALITGISGQDGSYLCDLLLGKEYEVHGVTRDPSRLSSGNLAHLMGIDGILGRRLFIHAMEDFDSVQMGLIINKVRPDEIYHLAGQSSPRLSFDLPEETLHSNATYTLQLLELNRFLDQPARLFFASSCEVFGKTDEAVQDETTPVRMATPYGAAKAYSQQLVSIYRENYGIPCGSGILFNHESPRRSPEFVSKKIARGVAAIKTGILDRLQLGNLDAKRDWGWAPDFVYGIWQMLQEDEIEDYVFATGESHSVQELVDACFRVVNLDWEAHVDFDASLARRVELHPQKGNPSKARDRLGWKQKVGFAEMAERLVEAELKVMRGSLGKVPT